MTKILFVCHGNIFICYGNILRMLKNKGIEGLKKQKEVPVHNSVHIFRAKVRMCVLFCIQYIFLQEAGNHYSVSPAWLCHHI